jgi:hypothetical protein
MLSPKNYNKKFRICVILNVLLKGFLKLHRIKLIKWYIYFNPNNKVSLFILVMMKTQKGDFTKKFKKPKRVYAYWNYTYFHNITNTLKKLPDFHTFRELKRRVQLGSGRFWHKIFWSIFFNLGNNSDHLVKFFKKTRKVEDVLSNRTFDLILKQKNMNLTKKKLVSFPFIQFKFIWFFKILNLFNLFKSNINLRLVDYSFFQRLLFIFYHLNYFNKLFFSKKKNKQIKKIYSRFKNTTNTFYNIFFFKVVPKEEVKINYFTWFKGEKFKSKNTKPGKLIFKAFINKKKNFLNWLYFFDKGYYHFDSIKRIFRKHFYNHIKKSVERRSFINKIIFYLIYSFYTQSYNKKNVKISYFFNRFFKKRLLLFIKQFNITPKIISQIDINLTLKIKKKKKKKLNQFK